MKFQSQKTEERRGTAVKRSWEDDKRRGGTASTGRETKAERQIEAQVCQFLCCQEERPRGGWGKEQQWELQGV